MIEGYVFEWLNLLGRAVHVIAGIAWIGASFYFVWLDNHLKAPVDAGAQARGVGGELWAVHGGGFYHSQKYLGAPPALPATLHWFKWEAYTTLLSGLFLLVLIYYLQAEVYLIDHSVADLSAPAAVALGVAWLATGWLAYDVSCRLLGARDRVLAAVIALLCAGAAYGLCHLFSGRAAYLHFGAMLGTIMVSNVFFMIIPAQRAMVEAVAAGRAPDIARATRARQRSVHNTYFTLPALFAMISIHYGWIWSADLNWLWLLTISAATVLVRAFFVARHRGRAPAWMLIAAAILLAATAYGLKPRVFANPWTSDPPRTQAIVAERCTPCHSATPRFAGVTAAPKAVILDDAAQLRTHAAAARAQLASRAMPPGNVTGLTDDERAALIAWIDAPHGR
ncbi:MAG TPA: urate hydroxylase PuuD [Usitatibacter sp.]|nr:urate hydroxylase PuuD [Usitatibacter sp.]